MPQDAVADNFLAALAAARHETWPYHHWFLEAALPDEVADGIAGLPFAPPGAAAFSGKRETNNATRVHFSPSLQERFPVAGSIAEAFQDPAVVRRLEETCGVDLRGSFLRIEYCQDKGGFWLKPHTDIGAKLFTMMIFLCEGDGAENWGTDILDAEHRLVARAPCGFNVGMIFIPGENTWHAFQERPIDGVRRSLMINYVKDEWRSTHELSFPDHPIQ